MTNLRSFNIVQDQVGHSQQIRQRLFLPTENSGLQSVELLGRGDTAHMCDGAGQETTGSAGGVYKNAVFDTNRKSLLRHISAEKGLK